MGIFEAYHFKAFAKQGYRKMRLQIPRSFREYLKKQQCIKYIQTFKKTVTCSGQKYFFNYPRCSSFKFNWFSKIKFRISADIWQLLTRPDRALLPRFYKSSVQSEDLNDIQTYQTCSIEPCKIKLNARSDNWNTWNVPIKYF